MGRVSRITERMAQIAAASPQAPQPALAASDSEFRQLAAELEEAERGMGRLDGRGQYVGVTGALAYAPRKTVRRSVRYGVSGKGVRWTGGAVEIDHMLGGPVNVVVDGTLRSKVSFRVFEPTADTVRIAFSSPKHAVCGVRVFRIG